MALYKVAFIVVKYAITIIIIISLHGCALYKDALTNSGTQRCDQLYQNSSLDPIRGKLALRAQDVTSDMTDLFTYPSPQERFVIGTFIKLKNDCNQLLISVGLRISPQNINRLLQHQARTNSVYAKLYNGYITYGDANEQIARSYTEYLSQY